jgi:UDP-MurNAc hydroxylase
LAALVGAPVFSTLLRILSTGHAGLLLDTAAGRILCDPWRSPAYLASWFVFPDNSHIDFAGMHPDYLYISHLHRDHFDPDLLRSEVDHSATVLLPDFASDDLESALRSVGFERFLHTRDGEPVDLDGLRVMITALVSPADGPLGDSALSVDDGEVRVLNQNDARPRDLDRLLELGPYDGHFLQYSGAIWYPVVYDLPADTVAKLGARKRVDGMTRAMRFVEAVDARFVFPNSGPACFLDDDLFEHNDFDGSESNPFPDQLAFLAFLEEHGIDRARLIIPGSEIVLTPEGCSITHDLDSDTIEGIFKDKRSYLGAYAARKLPLIEAAREEWGRNLSAASGVHTAEVLAEWWNPLLELGDQICAGVDACLLLDLGEERIVVDFHKREVRSFDGEECRYSFKIAPELVATQIARHEVDWVNSLFLSLRFEASRKGAYNEHIYTFFKCLAPDRVSFAEGWYDEQEHSGERIRIGDYLVQRRCPHLKADLSRFGQVKEGILQCMMHGWQFDLETGRCLTSDSHHLECERVDEASTSAGSA